MQTLKNIIDVCTKAVYWLTFVISMLFFLPLIYLGFKDLIGALFNDEEGKPQQMVQILHSLEYFFLAPVPALIIFSFRNYILKIFPKKGDNDKNDHFNISPEQAERAFISSLIGVISSFLLGHLIEYFTKLEANPGLKVEQSEAVLLATMLLLLTIMIWLYKVISAGIKE